RSSRVPLPYTSGSREPSLPRFGPLRTRMLLMTDEPIAPLASGTDLLVRGKQQALVGTREHRGPRNIVQHDEPEHAAPRLLVALHDAEQGLPAAERIGGGQLEGFEDAAVAVHNHVGKPYREPREFGRVHHAYADGGAVPPQIALRVLDRVAEGVAVVEDLAQAGLLEVLTHDARLDAHGELHDAAELLARRVGGNGDILLDDVENLGGLDEAVLHDLAESREDLHLTEPLERVQVGQHDRRRVESAHEVLALS